jgi:hypothetical protein
MSKADQPTTLIRSRRAVLAGVMSAALPIAAALLVAALAMPAKSLKLLRRSLAPSRP